LKAVSIETQRGCIAGLRFGNPEGQPVLALHGWLDNAASFIPMASYLSAYDIVAIDMLGHGASTHIPKGYDYAFVDWLHDILDVLDALEWQQAHLLGHSLGGALASVLAAGAPERVRSLALIEALGPPPWPGDHAAERLRKAIAGRRKPISPPRLIPDIETAVRARLQATEKSEAAARLLVERNLRQVAGGYQWRSDPRLMWPSHLRAEEASVRNWLSSIECPVLLIAADPAPVYFTPELRNARFNCLKRGEQHVIPGTHHVHMDKPEIVAALINDFWSALQTQQMKDL
jgi:pimeloyl-ACP methyl ester carboxylesterase